MTEISLLFNRVDKIEKLLNGFDALLADNIRLSWLIAEAKNENDKMLTRIVELERKIDAVDTEYVHVGSDIWVNIKDTKRYVVNDNKPIRHNMICKLVNLETLVITGNASGKEILANSNVSRLEIRCEYLPNLQNFPNCRMLSICGGSYLSVSNIISTLSMYKHNITTLSVNNSNDGLTKELPTLNNYCKSNGITMVKYEYYAL
jgi:hypothetical protein